MLRVLCAVVEESRPSPASSAGEGTAAREAAQPAEDPASTAIIVNPTTASINILHGVMK